MVSGHLRCSELLVHPEGDLCPRGDAKLAQYVADVGMDRPFGHDQAAGYLAVRQSALDQSGDLVLALCEQR
jgi:hypothetical protein